MHVLLEETKNKIEIEQQHKTHNAVRENSDLYTIYFVEPKFCYGRMDRDVITA